MPPQRKLAWTSTAPRGEFGCNIGAYFGGIASFPHGWISGVMAIVGTAGGLALRPLFGVTNPKPSDSAC